MDVPVSQKIAGDVVGILVYPTADNTQTKYNIMYRDAQNLCGYTKNFNGSSISNPKESVSSFLCSSTRIYQTGTSHFGGNS